MTGVAAVLAFCRFGQDAAAVALWGGSAFLGGLVPLSLADVVADRLRCWAVAAVLVAAAATVSLLPVDVASIGDGWGDVLDPATVGSVLAETSVGQAWTAQSLATLLLLLACRAPLRFRRSATAGAAALLLAGLALSGHAAMQEGWRGVLHRVNDVLHLLAGGGWLGALPPVFVILDLSMQDRWRPAAAVALRRFSRAGHVAVAVVVLTGLANTVLVLGRWPTDLSSPYEALLDAKIAAVAAMIGLAVFNRYVLVPRLDRDPAPSVAALRRATLAEMVLGLGVLGLVAVFGLLDPA